MTPIFSVTTPAESNAILTTAEARTALGIGDSSRDTDLTRVVSRISAAIFRACKPRSDGVNPPTLLSEAVSDTFRLSCHVNGALLLSRRRISTVGTVIEGETDLEDTDFDVDPASGLIYRLSSNGRTCWPKGNTVIAYTAGFTVVPDDLKLAAETWLRSLWRDAYQSPATINDPLVKVDDIPGVRRVERWVNPTVETILPPEVQSILIDGGYIETWVA